MLNFVDKSSFVTQADTCYLSIQANLNGFSFCVTTSAAKCIALVQYEYSKPVLSYDDLAGELQAIFEKELLLQKTYAATYCMFLTNKSILMPHDLLDREQLRSCLARVVELDELDEIHFRKTVIPEAVAIFAVPSPLAGVITHYHPDTVFMHQSLPLLSYLSTCVERQRASLYIEGKLATIVLFNNNQLVLSNTFPVESINDALYYLTFAAKEWDIDIAFLSLYFTGAIEEENKEVLKKYFPMVNFVSGDVSMLVGKMAAVRYQPLLMLHKCE